MIGFHVSLSISNYSNVVSLSSLRFDNIPSNILPTPILKAISRTRRDLQRCNSTEYHHVFGCTHIGIGVDSPLRRREIGGFSVSSCLSPDPSSPPSSVSGPKTKLYVSGLSFRTTEDNLRKAFEQFGNLVFVNLVMDKIANRPRGFAFLRYETEEESMKAIEGMHGKFLDGRVIFVEEAKPRSDIQRAKPRSHIQRNQSKPRTFGTW